MTESQSPDGLGEIFGDTAPENDTERRTEYWYWNEKHTVGKMTCTRDANGRFVDFHYYKPLVVGGEETTSGKRDRADNLGELFG